jgi:hypothetical protein
VAQVNTKAGSSLDMDERGSVQDADRSHAPGRRLGLR